MDLIGLVQQIEASPIGEWMRTSVKAMPVVESVHVLAIAVVFGTILIVDARLLGLLDKRRSYGVVSGELLPWTWAAFVVAAVTGFLMFTANATTYYDNTPFRLKMLAIAAAGLNMAVFHLFTGRHTAEWEFAQSAPRGGRIAAGLSIAIWTSVILLGRWIGFTKGYDFEIPEDVDFDFLEISFNSIRELGGAAAARFG
ncbi:MAG TPA: DUF6644 family protein [Gammaproteobacteria bacterium]